MLPELVTPIPGPKSRNLAHRLRAHESRNITHVTPGFPVFWERASGANVWDVDGNRFLDFSSGFGVCTAGFGDPGTVEIFKNQPEQLYHGMGDVHPVESKVRLCELLSKATFERWGAGAGKVILGNSGFEAVEAALKTACLATGRRSVICFEGGYHGLGYGALTVTGRKEFSTPFRSQLADFSVFLPYPDLADCPPDFLHSLEKLIRKTATTREVGAILVEPAQGRGGEIFPPRSFLPLLRKLADELGLILVFDEIYTGFYRTGPLFACDASGVIPDLICLGKAMSGAYPISACVGRADLMDIWPESTGEALHTSTFLGNPVGCAIAAARVEKWLTEPPVSIVSVIAGAMQSMLASLREDCPSVRRLRGAGLMWGLELAAKDSLSAGALAGQVVESSLAGGAILLAGGSHGNVLSFSPCLSIRPDEIQWLGGLLRKMLRR